MHKIFWSFFPSAVASTPSVPIICHILEFQLFRNSDLMAMLMNLFSKLSLKIQILNLNLVRNIDKDGNNI